MPDSDTAALQYSWLAAGCQSLQDGHRLPDIQLVWYGLLFFHLLRGSGQAHDGQHEAHPLPGSQQREHHYPSLSWQRQVHADCELHLPGWRSCNSAVHKASQLVLIIPLTCFTHL